MLRFCLNISSILVFLWINSLTVTIVNATTMACNIGFSKNQDGSAQCKVFGTSDTVTYNCDYKTCWNKGHQWVLKTGCRLAGIKGTSNQQCSEYLASGQTIRCNNPSRVPYTCDLGSDWIECEQSTCKLKPIS